MERHGGRSRQVTEGHDSQKAHGDPTEIALLAGARLVGLSPRELHERFPEARETPFSSETMMMATVQRGDPDGEAPFFITVKGAPVRVVAVCTSLATGGTESAPLDDAGREAWSERARELAGNGLRVLAVAEKKADREDEEPYAGLTLLGLCGLYDPPRQDVPQAIRECRTAGIRVVMVTGDQPETGRAIAEQVGILHDHDDHDGATLVRHGRDLDVDPEALAEAERKALVRTRVFARVSPEQKLRLVELFKKEGQIVAMTGDGVNDAPALKRADIGVAMGVRGTDAAREVSDMILQDDAFPSIVSAVREGRVIFNNIRKSVMFMLCTNVAEVFAVAAAALSGPYLAKWAGLELPIPLRALQILFLNVVTDTFPAMALGVGPGVPGVMNRPPRDPAEPILTRRHWRSILGWSFVIGLCVLAAAFVSRNVFGDDEATAVTASFLTLAFGKLWFVPNLRSRGTTLLHNEVVRNRWGWAAVALCTALLLAAVYLPGLNDVLQTRPLSGRTWLLVIGLSLVPVVIGQTMRAFEASPREGR
ncbi:MAG TPA: HAD-IC family P-type ATPase [Planctomycetaceae bacterium]